MDNSTSIENISKALCKAQSQMNNAKKSGSNPHFKSSYSKLSDIIDVAKAPLAENGIFFTQLPITEENRAGVETILIHESGERLSSKLLLPSTQQTPQAYGSAITYAKRYGLQSMLGIPSDDDDGQAASHTSNSYQHRSNQVRSYQNDSMLATNAQKEYLKRKGIDFPENITSEEAQNLASGISNGADS